MRHFIRPGGYAESVNGIDYEALFRAGYRGILFDIDNTLVPHGADATPEAEALFRHLRSIGLKTIILSNNDAARVERFLKNIDAPYVCDAEKPKKTGYQKALSLLGLRSEEAVCIGDQLFTDVLGANLCGICSILVRYIGYEKKEKKGIRRRLESAVLWLFRNQRQPAYILRPAGKDTKRRYTNT